jgi:hypothetical protein
MNVSYLYLGGLSAYAHFCICKKTYPDVALAIGFFARSKTAVAAIAQKLGDKTTAKVQYDRYDVETRCKKPWKANMKYFDMGRDHFTYCLAFNSDLGDTYLLSDRDGACDDLYDYLMRNFKMPLLKEWMPALMTRLQNDQLIEESDVKNGVYGNQDFRIPIHGKQVAVSDLVVYDCVNLSEETLEAAVSDLVKSGKIKFAEKRQNPLEFESLDEYFNKYGAAAIKNLHANLNPLTELKANVRNLAIKNKSLFPQQAATVEGIVAMEEAGHKYAVINHGMGCGKTIEAASACEAIMVGKWLKAHPDKTLKDAYERDGIINYRTIIMAPGHLVEKWGQEVREEIPYAKVTIINGLRDLTKLREQGRKAQNGKEFFVISKDKAKLGTQLSPIPVKVAYRPISLDVCEDCARDDQKIVYKKGVGRDAFCPACHGKNFKPLAQADLGKFKGLICPYCGELLLKYASINPDSDVFREYPGNVVLGPVQFAKYNQGNSACHHCGGALWGANARPITLMGREPKSQKWKKISHYANFAKKSTESAFVLKGFEEDYLAGKVRDGMKEIDTYGPRKVAPAGYLKKYLKGYFDFCILDEAHKYLGESAQAVGAHALVKASRFTMALTGTISNGTATCFYNLFFMLEPKKLISMGFRYGSGDRQRFCREYGCVEQEFGVAETVGKRNVCSRGKALSSPKVKPGISPVLFGSLLMDCSLFMDISDLSKYLPPLRESVRVVPFPDDVSYEYKRVLEVLGKQAKMGGYGMSILAQQLQFGLTYPDKPYGRGPIKDPFVEDAIVCGVGNFDEYGEGRLLPKEEALVEIINDELSEGRNCFVYATATNGAEACITYRLKEVIERECNLHGRVEVIESSSPQACDREAWFHKRAAAGIRVFITNPRCVETGLDFCFKHEGVFYNYPTLIFYQTSYELATIWQASRRAYRLSQKEECRTIYLAYDKTLQVAALQIMAKKQVATAAIQGHFSAEGLASMAQGVDARTLLAQALSEKDMGSSDGLADMFDVLAKSQDGDEDEFGAFVPSKTFYDLVGRREETAEPADDFLASLEFMLDVVPAPVAEPEPVAEVIPTPVEEVSETADDFLSDIEALLGMTAEAEKPEEKPVALAAAPVASKKKKSVANVEGQLDLFSLCL